MPAATKTIAQQRPTTIQKAARRLTRMSGGTDEDAEHDVRRTDLAEDTDEHWWIFLLNGIAWLVFALLVFQWDYTTVYAVSFLFASSRVRRANEFLHIAVSTTGWKIAHGSSAAFRDRRDLDVRPPHTACIEHDARGDEDDRASEADD